MKGYVILVERFLDPTQGPEPFIIGVARTHDLAPVLVQIPPGVFFRSQETAVTFAEKYYKRDENKVYVSEVNL